MHTRGYLEVWFPAGRALNVTDDSYEHIFHCYPFDIPSEDIIIAFTFFWFVFFCAAIPRYWLERQSPDDERKSPSFAKCFGSMCAHIVIASLATLGAYVCAHALIAKTFPLITGMVIVDNNATIRVEPV